MWQAVKSLVTSLINGYLAVSRFVAALFFGPLRAIKSLLVWAVKLLLPVVVFYLAYIAYLEWSDYSRYSEDDRGAAALVADPIDPDVAQDQISYLPQNWTVRDSNWFYYATQGSNLIPYDFFLHLEQKDSRDPFMAATHMNAFRYLPQKKSKGNPDGLPVGMTRDEYQGRSYMGFTCAACHTSQINYIDDKGVNHGIRIDGGPAAADMEMFMVALANAMDATRKDPAKRDRFTQAVVNQKNGDYRGDEEAVLRDLDYYTIQLQAYVDINSPVDDLYLGKYAPVGQVTIEDLKGRSHYGFARLDAFGRIFNRGLQHVIEPQTFRRQLESKLPVPVVKAMKKDLDDIYGESSDPASPTPVRAVVRTLVVLEKNTPVEYANEVLLALRELRSEIYNPADAAASYPYLWDVPQHDYIQWTGLVSNSGLGPLGRNTGQVIGVFGTLDWQKKKGNKYFPFIDLPDILRNGGVNSHYVKYTSSIDKANLRRVELALRDLWSPQWPEDILGNLDDEKIARGRALFIENCRECHHDIQRDDPERRVIAHISGIESAGTDPVLAQNAVQAKGSAGILSGRMSGDMVGDIVLSDDSPVPSVIRTATKGVIATLDPDKTPLRSAVQWAWDLIRTVRNNDIKPSRRMGNYDLATPQKPYAPITGYKARPLNGIWATAPYMHNGSIPNLYEVLLPEGERSDTFMVGSRQFDSDNVGFKSSEYPAGTGFLFDTALRGNSNAGHEYGTEMTPQDRQDLLEYLKQL